MTTTRPWPAIAGVSTNHGALVLLRESLEDYAAGVAYPGEAAADLDKRLTRGVVLACLEVVRQAVMHGAGNPATEASHARHQPAGTPAARTIGQLEDVVTQRDHGNATYADVVVCANRVVKTLADWLVR
ncbi:hypothetical protein ACQCX5_14465 [Propionibacteriaceae bacterium G57]|uniref:hypothetical protein n=1 Tax=Aestuariimicrobium sp. G57 TaxID=3418485 RepID=UPI003DA70E2E